MRVVYMGSPEFAIPPLEKLVLNGHQVMAVYTRPDKPAGRGRELAATPVKNAALSLGLPVIEEPSLKKPEAIERLAGLKPEAVVVAAFGQLLPQDALDIPCYGCLNIHPSLLPKYRGPSPVPAAILAGDEFAGVSIMRLDARMDTGPVFTRAQIPVLKQDTAFSLTSRLFLIGAWMLMQTLAELEYGKALPEPQNDAQATYTGELSRQDGLIDWKTSATDIWRHVRAYQPWPQAYTIWQGKQVKIIEASPLRTQQAPGPGRVVALKNDKSEGAIALGIGTGDGVLGVLRLQIEGKRPMSADEFLRGQRDFIGAELFPAQS
jgi:methionyl-tRNA formyltransferase